MEFTPEQNLAGWVLVVGCVMTMVGLAAVYPPAAIIFLGLCLMIVGLSAFQK